MDFILGIPFPLFLCIEELVYIVKLEAIPGRAVPRPSASACYLPHGHPSPACGLSQGHDNQSVFVKACGQRRRYTHDSSILQALMY